MNTYFNILWIEDEPEWQEIMEEDVTEFLAEHVLQPQYTVRAGDDIVEEDYLNPQLDLILMDYNLREGVKGDEIIQAIRESKVLTDIMFYSSEPERAQETIRNGIPLMDGVYLSPREDELFLERVKQIISKIVRRSEDVINLRGVVLDNTSKFETRVQKILDTVINNIDEDNQSVLEKMMYGEIEKNIETANKILETPTYTVSQFRKQNKNHFVINMNNRLNILCQIIEILKVKYNMTILPDNENVRDYYYIKIGNYRNKLGHADADAKSITIDSTEILIDQELHRQLRKNIVEVDKLLISIESYVNQLKSD